MLRLNLCSSLLWVSAGWMALGCSREQDHQGLKAALAEAEAAGRASALTISTLTTVKDVQAVLRHPFARRVAPLTGLTLVTEAHYALTDRDEPSSQALVRLSERRVLQLESAERFWVTHSNQFYEQDHGDGSDGRACGVVDGQYYTARAYGRPTRLAVLADEAESCLNDGVEPLEGLFGLLASRVLVAGVERREIVGRAVMVVKLSLKPGEQDEEAPPPVPLAWQSAEPTAATMGPRASLFELHARPLSVKGELVLDVATATTVGGYLEGRFCLRKAGQDAWMSAKVTLTASSLGGPLVAPAEARDFGPRPRIFADRAALLGEKPLMRAADSGLLPAPGADAGVLQVVPDEAELEEEAIEDSLREILAPREQPTVR